ncbi:MAG: PLD nuclease N-terminal domain-containing protein [Anaerolineae bacterium]
MEELTEFLPLIIPILLLELALMVVALVDLLRRERTRNLPKWAWILIVVLFQIIGPIAYFLAGRED